MESDPNPTRWGGAIAFVTGSLDAVTGILTISDRVNVDGRNEDESTLLSKPLVYERGWGGSPSFCFATLESSGASSVSTGTSKLAIDPKGSPYKCREHARVPARRVGDLLSVRVSSEESGAWRRLGLPDACCKYGWVPVCKSGCPARRIEPDDEPACLWIAETPRERLFIVAGDHAVNTGRRTIEFGR